MRGAQVNEPEGKQQNQCRINVRRETYELLVKEFCFVLWFWDSNWMGNIGNRVDGVAIAFVIAVKHSDTLRIRGGCGRRAAFFFPYALQPRPHIRITDTGSDSIAVWQRKRKFILAHRTPIIGRITICKCNLVKQV